jgi:hypothetical protein
MATPVIASGPIRLRHRLISEGSIGSACLSSTEFQLI